MEEHTPPVELLLEKVKEYGQTTLQLIKLKALDKTSDVVSTLVPRTISILLGLVFALFASIGLAVFLGVLLQNDYCGYFIVAGIYGLAWVIMRVFLQGWLKSKISNSIIQNILQ